MDYGKEALRLHAQHKGKICVNGKVEVNTPEDLSLAYTPGVRTGLTVKMFLKDLYGIGE